MAIRITCNSNVSYFCPQYVQANNRGNIKPLHYLQSVVSVIWNALPCHVVIVVSLAPVSWPIHVHGLFCIYPQERETTLHCDVSHWLGTYTKWSLLWWWTCFLSNQLWRSIKLHEYLSVLIDHKVVTFIWGRSDLACALKETACMDYMDLICDVPKGRQTHSPTHSPWYVPIKVNLINGDKNSRAII